MPETMRSLPGGYVLRIGSSVMGYQVHGGPSGRDHPDLFVELERNGIGSHEQLRVVRTARDPMGLVRHLYTRIAGEEFELSRQLIERVFDEHNEEAHREARRARGYPA